MKVKKILKGVLIVGSLGFAVYEAYKCNGLKRENALLSQQLESKDKVINNCYYQLGKKSVEGSSK